MSKKSLRITLFIFLDIISVFATLYLSLGLRIGFNAITRADGYNIIITGIIMTVVTLAVYIVLKLYNTMWEYASVDELIKIVLANIGILGCSIYYKQHYL